MTSPFSEGRFEHGPKHCFYLHRESIEALERHKPIYLIGSRGSGKTTLLMSLNWEERLNNETLRRQFENQPFRGLYIGTYVKLPKIQFRSFERWLHAEEDDLHGLLVGRYCDLVFVETMAGAVADLLALHELRISPALELEAVTRWVSEYSRELLGQPPDSVCSVAAFRNAVRIARKELELCSRLRAPVEECLDRFAVDQIGVWSTAMSKRMADLCNNDKKGHDGQWHFKLCMDEGECLSPFQQRVMNTIVRLSEWPFFPVVSFVSHPADITTTLVPELTLQQADRELVVLDSMDAAQFVDFAEGVATVRCQEASGRTDIRFASKSVLGRLDLNQLLTNVLERSESPKARELLSHAIDFAKSIGHTGNYLPIYESYLAEMLALKDLSGTDTKAKRQQSSQQYRKKMVAAYLSICNDLKLRNIPYASAEMVFGISDNCIRDFLSQMDHIYLRFGDTLEGFLMGTVDVEVQSRAIREASEEKKESIPGSGVSSPVEAGRIVRGLAMVTGMLQRSSSNGSHLRSAERGLFRLLGDSGREAEELRSALSLVRDAADAGFLRLIPKDDHVLFRVHASLAPAFGFSYRGAYYEVPLLLQDFRRLRCAKNDKELLSTAQSIVAGVPAETKVRSLFSMEEASGAQ